MDQFEWRPFLERFSEAMLEDDSIRDRLPSDVVSSGWLGFDPASADEIDALESRIDASLPPSYRSFLETTNGWRDCGAFIYRMWSTHEVDWFRVRHQQWIDAYEEPWKEGQDGEPALPSIPDEEYFVYGGNSYPPMRVEYLPSTLDISDVGDSAIVLLNPEVIFDDGEWEAWFFATLCIDPNRYRSFRELMEGAFAGFLKLRNDDED